MSIQLKRPAIAMIELIFAIVIMGIVMMSAPMLISTATKSTIVALQQEGISQAVSDVSTILTYEWDENNLNNTSILHVTHGDDELNATIASSELRVGVPDYPDRSSRTFSELNASALGIEGSEKNDIDDFNGTKLNLDPSGTGGKDYIEQDTVSIATAIYYAPDTATYSNSSLAYSFTPDATAGGGSSNIKAIKVTVTSTSSIDELKKEITLHAFSCNLGGSTFEHRQPQ